ncbi:MAG: Ig-like domain-containing protein, partial [bacterium]
MTVPVLLALLAVQQPEQPPAAPQLPQPIARVEVRPAEYALRVGDSVRLAAVAFDSAGRPLEDVQLRWFTNFEGSVDSTGLVRAGATGTLNVAAVASVRGRVARATVGTARITILPPPAAKLVVSPRPARMLAGTSLMLEATPYAANDDRRYDPVTWRSSRPAVLQVNAYGRFSAGTPGRATITATAGNATASWMVTVVANDVARVAVAPADTAVRTGD